MPTLYKWGAGLDPGQVRIDHAEEEFLVTAEGDRIIDAAAGAAVVNLGHSLPSASTAMAEQADRVGYLSTSTFTSASVDELTAALAAVSPADLDTVFYVNSGSEANEAAIKLARAYHVVQGRPEKVKVVSRWQSYHGSTLGALAATGSTGRRRWYTPMLAAWPHVPPAYPYRWDYTGTPAEQAVACARELETAIRQAGPETVAAFIAEPVGGSSMPGARPHPAYYEEVRRICDEHDVLFIADEVMTGFGRTGAMFGVEHYDVVPDLMSVGKGLSSGYAPISAVLVRNGLASAIDGAPKGSFYHGHTFSANPVSTAVAADVVPRYTEELLARVRDTGDLLLEELGPLENDPMVGEIRGVGLLVGIEFVADAATTAPFDPDLRVARRVFRAALDRGVYTYPGGGSVDGVAGDHLQLSPPLTTSEASIREVASVVVDAVKIVGAELREDGAWADYRPT